jgi:hypothetical protein
MHHFVEVSQHSEELLELSAEELLPIVAADDLNVGHEEIVWEYVLRWIEHDAVNRKGHIGELMKNIRMGLMDRNYFLNNVSKHLQVCACVRPHFGKITIQKRFLGAFDNNKRKVAPVGFVIYLSTSQYV